MKKTVLFTLVVALFSLNSAAFADEAKSEHYSMPIAQTPTFNNDSSARNTKRLQYRKEQEQIRTAFEAASFRDHDLKIEKISLRSFYCDWAGATTMYEKWLVKNPDVVVDRKEHMESWAARKATQIGNKQYIDSECTASIMVHYHKDGLVAEIAKNPNMVLTEIFASEEFSATRKKRSTARDAAMVKAMDWIAEKMSSAKEDSARFVQETFYNRKTKRWTSEVTVVYKKEMLINKNEKK